MNTAAFFEWIFGECETVLTDSNAVSLATPSHHVDIADAHDETVYPFIGVVPISFTAQTAGIGNSDLLTETTYTEGGTFGGVTRTLRREFSVEITPVTDDDEQLRDTLSDEIAIHFALLAEHDDTPADVDQLSVTDTTPSNRPDSFVRANGVELTGVVSTHTDDDLPAAESVDITVSLTDAGVSVPLSDP
jgi:hypothetical protein